MATRLQQLRTALRDMKRTRKERIRDITQAGVLSSFPHTTNGFLVESINELWDLVVDVADRRLREAIKVEANKMIEEAQKAL